MCEAEPLSENRQQNLVTQAKAALEGIPHHTYSDKFLWEQMLRWAATVAAQAAKIKELHKQGGRLFCQRAANSDLVVGLHCDNGDVLIGARSVAGYKDIEQIEAYIAALRGEEEGDGHAEGDEA